MTDTVARLRAIAEMVLEYPDDFDTEDAAFYAETAYLIEEMATALEDLADAIEDMGTHGGDDAIVSARAVLAKARTELPVPTPSMRIDAIMAEHYGKPSYGTAAVQSELRDLYETIYGKGPLEPKEQPDEA